MRFRVSNPSDLNFVLHELRKMTDEAKMNARDSNLIITSTSELGTNILKYAVKGFITMRLIEDKSGSFVEVTATDRGPGIEDVNQALSDHFSSSGTLGLGLPGIKRAVDQMTIHSEPGQGTKIIIRKKIRRN